MSETTQNPSEGSDAPVLGESPVEETPSTTGRAPEHAPEAGSQNTAPENVELGEDPTKSAQPEDESDLEMDELVSQIFAGKWGNGQQRRNRLAAAGYNHVEVQDAVNARMNEARNK